MSSLDEERIAFKRGEQQWVQEFMGSSAGMVHREDYEALAAERDRLREALEDLLEDTEHKDHDCGDADCCVAKARAALASGTPVDVE